MPMHSCFITGSYYARNALKHMYHNWLDETILYYEKTYQIRLRNLDNEDAVGVMPEAMGGIIGLSAPGGLS
jgi:hypothetical protein